MLEYCKEFANDSYEFFHGKKLYLIDGRVIDEETNIVENKCIKNEKGFLAFPSEKLRKALSAGIKKEISSCSGENVTKINTNCVLSGTSIPTKMEIKLSKKSEQKLYELGCFLSNVNKRKKNVPEEKMVHFKNVNNKNYLLTRTHTESSDQHESSMLHWDYMPCELDKECKLYARFSPCDTKPKHSEFKRRKPTFILELGRNEIIRQQKKYESIRRLKRENVKDVDIKLVIDRNIPRSFGKKSSKQFDFSAVYEKKNSKCIKKSKENVAEIIFYNINQSRFRLKPELKQLNCAVSQNTIKMQKQLKNKCSQTNHKELLCDVTYLLRKHKRLQEKNKSLSESLSCLLENFNTTSNSEFNQNSSLIPTIESSSIPIKNLHKIFQKE